VQVAERWSLARLRHEEFHTLEALNARIAELLEDINARTMRRYGASRRELFEQVERQHLLPLPRERFSFCEFARATINIDHHVAFDFHFYSVPYQLRYETEPVVELRVTSTTIEVLFKNRRITSHARTPPPRAASVVRSTTRSTVFGVRDSTIIVGVTTGDLLRAGNRSKAQARGTSMGPAPHAYTVSGRGRSRCSGPMPSSSGR
jgi:hypothetical protein